MHQQLSLMTLGASDLKTSLHLYQEVLGWKRSDCSNQNIVFSNGWNFFLYLKQLLTQDACLSHSVNFARWDLFKTLK